MRTLLSLVTITLLTMLPLRFATATQQEVTPVVSATEKSTQHEGIEISVNVNTADAAEIASMLKGVGVKKAQAIVDFRTENGHFADLNDLQKVKGIGAATVDKNKQRIKF